MKRHTIYPLLIVLASVCGTGCESEPGGSASSATASGEDDFMTFTRADGTKVSCWVSGNNHAGKRSWIWCDAETGPVSYRISGGGQGDDWKPMDKILVSDDDELKVTPDPEGQFGTPVLLPSGKYSISFKIGTEEFSAVALQVD